MIPLNTFPHVCPRELGFDCAICRWVTEKYSGREAISSMKAEPEGVESEVKTEPPALTTQTVPDPRIPR